MDELEKEFQKIIKEEHKIPIYKSSKKKYDTLVMSGGSIKGIAHLGGLYALEELGILRNIETYAGTSVGALIACLLCIGWKPLELLNFSQKFPFEKLKKINIFDITTKYGLDSGEAVEYFLKRFMKFKGFDENITLEELYEKTKKKIILVATCVNTCEAIYLSYETYPKLPVYLAIRMSTAIPFYFQPVQYLDNYYIDGACVDNYPIDLFKEQKENVIGLLIVDKTEKINNIDNLETFGLRVWHSFMKGIENNLLKYYDSQTIVLTMDNVNIFDFGLENEKKEKIFFNGYHKTHLFFSKK